MNDAGLSRESLYKAFSGEQSPSFDTIFKVMEALNLKLHAEAVHGRSSGQTQEENCTLHDKPTPRI